jgi:glycosidase
MMNIARWLYLIFILILASMLLIACDFFDAAPTLSPTSPPTVTPIATTPPSSGEAQWWNNAIFYQVFVRSFFDGDGDGIGDLKGLIKQLDYLNDGDPATTDDLGVTALWLMPVTESPSYHGYDVVDYRQIEQDYGTNEDFHRLVDEAHARDIRVIIDLVLNHSSSAHPWFEEARDDVNTDYRDWYIWREEHPGQVGPWNQPVWHADDGDYYYGLFWDGMPDLNYRNPAVTAQIHDVAQFWLEEMGADGFRLDAVQYLVEDEAQLAGTDETHTWLADFHRFYKDINPDAMTVGEVWANTNIVLPYVTGNELDMAFEFDLASAIVDSVNRGDPGWFDYVLTQVETSYPRYRYATFLTNHDQDRVMNQLNHDVDKAKLAATILLTLPGTPFIYYGEEIGTTGQKPDKLIRTPMQWNADKHAGFTTSQPWQPVNGNYETVNVAAQSSDPDSLLSHYRNLIHLRNEYTALRLGNLTALDSTCDSTYGYLRTHNDEQVLVILNFSDETLNECTFSLAQSNLSPGNYILVELPNGEVTSNLEVGKNGDFRLSSPEKLLSRENLIFSLNPN